MFLLVAKLCFRTLFVPGATAVCSGSAKSMEGCASQAHNQDFQRGITFLACIKAWVNEHAYNGEYTDILIMMTRN